MFNIDNVITESTESVYDVLDSLYIKQQLILESIDYNNTDTTFNCFQEGFFTPKSKELDVFKFENKHILSAIRYFNKAVKLLPFKEYGILEMKEAAEKTGSLDVLDIWGLTLRKAPVAFFEKVNNIFAKPNGPFLKAFEELEKQFDCSFEVNVYSDTTASYFGAEVFNENKGKLIISKSKGFQLGGRLVKIGINSMQILSFSPVDNSLFGQSLVGILLHEIYHNVARMLNERNSRVYKDIKQTLVNSYNLFKNDSDKTIKAVSNSFSSFIKRFRDEFNIKKNEFDEKRTINRLYVLSKIANDNEAIKKFKFDIENNVDKTKAEKELDKYIQTIKTAKSITFMSQLTHALGLFCVILAAGLGVIMGQPLVAAGGVIALVVMSLGMIQKMIWSLLGVSMHIREEYYADLFAGMYKLPVHLTSFNKLIKYNKVCPERIKLLRKVEQEFDEVVKDVHPQSFDRAVTSYNIAKSILESKQKLKPEIRKYLEYIVNLHEGIDELDTGLSKRQAKKVDPNAAKDLRNTLKEFAERSGTTITEGFVEELIDDFIGGDYYA